MTTFKKGDIVLYSPFLREGDPKFGGVVRDDSWRIGSGHWLTHVTGLSQEYQSFTAQQGKETASYVTVQQLELAPVFFCKDGRTWHTESLGEDVWIDGEIVYVMPGTAGALALPTGVGWAYTINTADGVRIESAESYEAARAAVEEICK